MAGQVFLYGTPCAARPAFIGRYPPFLSSFPFYPSPLYLPVHPFISFLIFVFAASPTFPAYCSAKVTDYGCSLQILQACGVRRKSSFSWRSVFLSPDLYACRHHFQMRKNNSGEGLKGPNAGKRKKRNKKFEVWKRKLVRKKWSLTV